MNADIVKKTQETLGKVIKRPQLTEKLLSRPPFRYLHDIFTEVIRTTGFMKGLYEENEMKADSVKEKDSKMTFLQKAIDVVMLVSGEPLAAKPARIVAGHEPEKTNELLQAIAKCCLNKMSSDEAVKRVLSGEKVDLKTKASMSNSQRKENREGHERHPDREEKKKITERSGSRDQKDPDHPKEREHQREREGSEKHHRSDQDHHKEKSRDRERDKDRDKGRVRDRDKEKERERDRERDKERERDRERDKDRERDRKRDKDRERDRERERDKDRERDRERERDKDRERDRERERDKDRERDRERERDKDRERDSHRDRERDKEKRKDRDKDQERDREQHKAGNERSRSGESGNNKIRESEEAQQKHDSEELSSKTAKTVPAPAEIVEKPESPAKIPRPSSAKGQRRRPKIGGQDESDSEADGDAQSAQRPAPQENPDGPSVPSDMAFSGRRIARPSSARPAPPRMKRQKSYTDATAAESLLSAKTSAPVIMDGKKLSDEEDEQFLVEEAVPQVPGASEIEKGPAQELDSEEKHGGLVKTILETKKDYELRPSSPKTKEQNLVSEAARKKEWEMVMRETDRLRSSIQMVCRSAMPLGKLMDYLQEDMDAMQAELHTWRRENKEHTQALLQEQRATDQALEPLKAELSELDQLIKDQQDKICAVKANILRNEEKIQKMVAGIASPPRS